MIEQKVKTVCLRFISILIISALIFMGFASVAIPQFETVNSAGPDSSDNIDRGLSEDRARPQANSPWPMFRQNMQHTGLSPYYTSNNIGDLKWKYETGNDVESSPAIGSDGTVYVSSHDGNVYAFTQDGQLKWKYDTKVMIRSSPAIGPNGTIYISSGSVFALNPDGTLKWEYHTGVPSKTGLTIGPDNTIYVLAGDYIYAIYPNGNLKWMVEPNHSSSSSPTVSSDGTIYFGSLDYFNALYPDGTFKWRFAIKDSYGYSTPSIDSNGIIYYHALGDLYAFFPNGTQKWKFHTGGNEWDTGSPAIASDGTIYIGTRSNLYSMYPNGSNKWVIQKDCGNSSPAISAEGNIYFGSGDSHVYGIYPNGTLIWKYLTELGIQSSPAIGKGGTIFIGSNDWYLYAIGGNVNTGNQAPIADAGQDQNTIVDQIVYLNASGSYDPDLDPLKYFWFYGDGNFSDHDDDGIPDYYENESAPIKVSHSYSAPGNYTVTLIVSDGFLEVNDTCIISVSLPGGSNSAPIADAGPDQNTTVNQTVNFDGSGSYDPDNDPLTYNWDFGDGTSTGWQGNCNSSHAYNASGNYTATLYVNDSELTDFDICIVHVSAGWVSNHLPSIMITEPDGDDDYADDSFIITWEDSDPDDNALVSLYYDTNDKDFNGVLIIKDIREDDDSDYYIWYTSTIPEDSYYIYARIIDGYNYPVYDYSDGPVTVIHSSENQPPVADAGPDQTVKIYQTVYFDCSGSYDLDGDVLFYKWEFGDGTFTNWRTDCNATYIYTTAGNYTATLTVYDVELTGTDTCVIFVTDEDVDISGNDTDGDGLPDDWELEHGLDPENPDDALLDSDGDTLTNLAEFEYGTDPNDKDTDSDGILDGWEIEYGLVPTDAKDALSDFDGDSLSNLKEFELGTNPMDKDTDGDGYTDYIDDYPTNADKFKKQVTDDNAILDTFTIIFIGMIILIILILMAAVIYKNKRKMGGQDLGSAKQFAGRHEVGDSSTAQELAPPEDLELESVKIIDDLKTEALSPRKPSSLDLSNEEMLTQFEEKHRDGKISDGTYNLIQYRLSNK